MPPSLEPPALFGDVLARARERWVREMARRLALRGFHDYRRSDAFALRLLVRGPLPLSRLTDSLGVSRQLTRKVVGGLVEREYATLVTDESDARRRIVDLSDAGRRCAVAVIAVLNELNAEVEQATDHDRLEVARTVLTYVADHFGP